jgi:excisionase family DNA binding protein
LSLVQTKQDKAMLKTTTIETPRVSSKKRAAEALGISERTLDRMIAAGMLKSIKVSMRRRVIPNTEIDRILGGQNVGPRTEKPAELRLDDQERVPRILMRNAASLAVPT